MPSLISDTEKANLTGIFGDIFDTFSREIYIYKQPQKVVPSGVTINTAFIFGYNMKTVSPKIKESIPFDITGISLVYWMTE